jgi:ribosomal protein L27
MLSVRLLVQVRNASKKTGGSSRNGRKSAGKRLGLKKTPNDDVICGHVLTRQRGLKLFPGEGVVAGRDHTLVAVKDGKLRLHYDITSQKRILSVDDGSLPKHDYLSERKIKGMIADRVDAEYYLGLDQAGKYNYVRQKVAELAREQENSKREMSERRLVENTSRRFDMVDLTLL